MTHGRHCACVPVLRSEIDRLTATMPCGVHLKWTNATPEGECATCLTLESEDAMKDVCHWTEDSDGNYHTDCSHTFTLIDGTPPENGMRFCCYCGRSLETVAYSDIDNGDVYG